jgi:ribosomal protein L11 methyltransferase
LAEYPALELRFLSASGSHAFLRERLYALLDDFDPTAIQEDEHEEAWHVFFASAERRDAAARQLAAAVAPHLLRTSPLDVPDEDWARRSQQNLRAIEVGGLTVAPPWDIPAGGPVIVIEPSTGFGTGHHATTRLCLQLLQDLDVRGGRVIDVGTGSGVLALAAWKLGAAEVVALDNDPDALDNARANIARNGAASAIDVVQGDLQALDVPAANIVLANLTAALLIRYAEKLRSLLRDLGALVLSGFSTDHCLDVGEAFSTPGFTLLWGPEDGEWSAAMVRRTTSPPR